jgi:hypothetical protein
MSALSRRPWNGGSLMPRREHSLAGAVDAENLGSLPPTFARKRDGLVALCLLAYQRHLPSPLRALAPTHFEGVPCSFSSRTFQAKNDK